jgi:hypothetical protein
MSHAPRVVALRLSPRWSMFAIGGCSQVVASPPPMAGLPEASAALAPTAAASTGRTSNRRGGGDFRYRSWWTWRRPMARLSHYGRCRCCSTGIIAAGVVTPGWRSGLKGYCWGLAGDIVGGARVENDGWRVDPADVPVRDGSAVSRWTGRRSRWPGAGPVRATGLAPHDIRAAWPVARVPGYDGQVGWARRVVAIPAVTTAVATPGWQPGRLAVMV